MRAEKLIKSGCPGYEKFSPSTVKTVGGVLEGSMTGPKWFVTMLGYCKKTACRPKPGLEAIK